VSDDPASIDAGAGFLAAIDAELGELDRRGLRASASALSQRYRSKGPGSSHDAGSAQLQAYLATRAPATFAAVRRVLHEVASLRPDWLAKSVLDLGAGPGTATWAAAEVFGTVERAVLVERDKEMAALGARLLERTPVRPAADIEWTSKDLTAVGLPESDLVIASYVLGELGPELRAPALEQWWSATRGELVIVEPGTPAGFERLREARTALIAWGAHLTAPCPHDGPCPMAGRDWCHFAVRLERSALHRDLKGARLGYEDEKYAYLAVSPSRTRAAVARLVRSPRLHKGHVRIVTCETDGLAERVVSRREGDEYKRARAARWGDRLDGDRGYNAC
jgi:ribosomal protein RSM22 (predicted rRNA methylase)